MLIGLAIIFGVLALVFLPIAVGTLIWAGVSASRARKFTRDAVRVWGTVVGVQARSQNVYTGSTVSVSKAHVETIEYPGPHGMLRGEPVYRDTGVHTRLGQRVPVFVDPGRPTRFAAPRDGVHVGGRTVVQSRVLGYVFLGLFVVFLGLAIVLAILAPR